MVYSGKKEVAVMDSGTQREILRMYGQRHRSGTKRVLKSDEVANLLMTSPDLVNDEMVKLEEKGFLEVHQAYGGNFPATITELGLQVLDEGGPISDKD
jgi:Mn-dependent DtxR family transcriptional regulator